MPQLSASNLHADWLASYLWLRFPPARSPAPLLFVLLYFLLQRGVLIGELDLIFINMHHLLNEFRPHQVCIRIRSPRLNPSHSFSSSATSIPVADLAAARQMWR